MQEADRDVVPDEDGWSRVVQILDGRDLLLQNSVRLGAQALVCGLTANKLRAQLRECEAQAKRFAEESKLEMERAHKLERLANAKLSSDDLFEEIVLGVKVKKTFSYD